MCPATARVCFLRWGATLAFPPSRLVPLRQDAPPAFTPCTSVSAREDKGAGIGFSSVPLMSAHLSRAYTPFVDSLYPPPPSLLPSATPAPRALLHREK